MKCFRQRTLSSRTMSQRFLISRLSALGDVVCSLPVAVALKRSFPESEITWVVDQRFSAVVECCGSVARVARVNRKGPSPELDALKGQSFDIAFDIQGLLKSAVVLSKVKAARKLGYHWQREGASLFSQRVIPDASSLHVVDQYVDVARAAGAEMDLAEFELVPQEGALASVREALQSIHVDPARCKLVLLNAGAGWASKRWPPSAFSTLCKLLKDAECQPVFIGSGSADQLAFDEIALANPIPPQSLIGMTSVAELIALVSIASAHVGGDTGSSHIAAALQVPAIGLYSRTRPERSCPYGQIERCHYDPESMSNIHPEAVAESVLEAIR